MKSHNMSMEDIEYMYPWERIVYIEYINMKLKEEEIKAKDTLNQQKDLNSLYRKLK